MNTADHQEDLTLAQETCDELRTGNNEAILPLYNKYQRFFLGYTRRRIRAFDDDRATSLLDDFWVELLNAKAICEFLGLSSLKTYLFKILNFRIIDNVRKADRKYSYNRSKSGKDHEIDSFGAENVSPEKDLMHKQKIRLIHETLLMLTDASPSDAFLVKMHLEGLEYKQMAERDLGNKSYSQMELKKRTNAIKKQFTRKSTGSRAKFESCLKRIMVKNKLFQYDILN